MTGYVRLQFLLTVRQPDMLAPLIVTPLYCLVLFTVLRVAGRTDLGGHVVVTVVCMAVWANAVFVASEIVEDDRWSGTLEPLLTAQGSYGASAVVRVLTATALSVPVLAEVLLIGRVGFGLQTTVTSWPLLLGGLGLLVGCTAGAALLVSGLLILSRGARTLQNALTYPFYLLGGFMVPPEHLPTALTVVARCFYLSWGVDVVRAGVGTPPPYGLWPSVAMTVALGLVQVAGGLWALRAVLAKVRRGDVPLTA